MKDRIKDWLNENWPHYAFCAIVFMAVSMFWGCSAPADAYIKANWQFSQEAGRQLIEYYENDEELADHSKALRIIVVEQWIELNEEAYESIKGGDSE